MIQIQLVTDPARPLPLLKSDLGTTLMDIANEVLPKYAEHADFEAQRTEAKRNVP